MQARVSELAFEVLDVRAQEHAASPHLLFRLGITESTGARVHALALRCQVRIEPQRRRYDTDEPDISSSSVLPPFSRDLYCSSNSLK